MSDGQGASALYLLLLLVLVGSALLARRVPMGQAARMALGWVLIFGVAVALYAYRDEARRFAQRMKGTLNPEAGEQVGSTLRIPMSDDGHFWIRGRINGTEVRFLIDSGATTTALSADTAQAAGLNLEESRFPVLLNTANGTVEARRVRVERLEVGDIRREDFAAITAPAFGSMNVLGMNFLSSLTRWGVEGRTLVLEP